MTNITSIPVDTDMLATEQQRQDEIDARNGIEDNSTGDGSGDRRRLGIGWHSPRPR